MSNILNITACDNELIIIAYNLNASFIIAHIDSGYYNSVNVNVNIEPGTYTGTRRLNGVSGPLNQTLTVYLPEGIYSVTAVCINWGGPWAYSYSLNNGMVYSQNSGSGVGAIASGPQLTVQPDTSSSKTLIFDKLVPGTIGTTSFSEGGYTLTSTNGSINSGNGGTLPPGNAVFPSGSTTQFTLARTDRSAFDLKSMDIRTLNTNIPMQSIVFNGILSNGIPVTHTIETDTNDYGFDTYPFPAIFSGLTSVTWSPKLTSTTNIILS